MNIRDRCPRCEQDQLKSWQELTDDEREVIKRLPGATDFPEEERRVTHRWCPRCWFESSENKATA